MAPPYIYTTEHRLALRSLTHKGLAISCRHPCVPYWRLIHSVPPTSGPHWAQSRRVGYDGRTGDGHRPVQHDALVLGKMMFDILPREFQSVAVRTRRYAPHLELTYLRTVAPTRSHRGTSSHDQQRSPDRWQNDVHICGDGEPANLIEV